jgi:two-component system phosphate regulon response regulator PhoB
MTRILAIDGDPDIGVTLARCLGPQGHRVIVATTGAEGMRLARAKRPGVVLLQQRLPDRNGLEVCKTLKGDPATERIPIVMVMDRPDAIERAVAHELGAADYLVKPFTVDQLVARVEATFAEPPEDTAAESQRFGYLTVSACGRRIAVEGRPVELTPVELALLLVLCEGGERVHAREELRARVWGEEGRDETRVVDQYVKRLRRKLGRAGRYVETVHGVGYRFAKGRAEREGEG